MPFINAYTFSYIYIYIYYDSRHANKKGFCIKRVFDALKVEQV